MFFTIGSFVFSCSTKILFSQDHSIARTWNEVILESIRNSGLINNKSLGVLELPKSNLQNKLLHLKIIKEKKVSNSLFLFFEIN